jgi:magnesium transporter
MSKRKRKGSGDNKTSGRKSAVSSRTDATPSAGTASRRLAGERSKKTGLPPGTPVLVGTRPDGDVRILLSVYDAEHVSQIEATELPDFRKVPENAGVTWVHVNGLHDLTLLDRLGSDLGIHPLVLEDIVNTEQRAKVEMYKDQLFVVMKMARLDPESKNVEIEQVSLLLSGQTVLSLQDSGSDLFEHVRTRLGVATSKLRATSADFLVYALLDEVSDNCFDVLEHLGFQIEQLEDSLMEDDTRNPLLQIKRLRGQLMRLHRSMWPMREVAGALSRGEFPQMKEETLLFLRDVQDHLIAALDTIDSYRELLNGLLDLHLSASGNRLNGIMKVLAIISTIFMPLSFIAGVYGMNFRHMPELEWAWGYYAVLLLMVAVVGGMLLVLRKKHWL